MKRVKMINLMLDSGFFSQPLRLHVDRFNLFLIYDLALRLTNAAMIRSVSACSKSHRRKKAR